MDATAQKKDYMKGGAFLIENRTADEIFTPEDLTEEQRMIGDTTRDFIDNEVIPNLEAMEHHDWELARQLIHKAGELGLLGANIPEEYGGLDLDQTTGVVVAENMGRGSGFGVTFGSQTSIGLLPILYFGSDFLKEKYIPQIISGEKITAYCLSESGSGSDALGAKCNAKLSEDGKSYILNGEKMWISNGSFSDFYIVFAKVDGEKKKFSAFVVERSETCRPGAEEHKMGIKSSSTTPLILSDCHVPVENLIGEVGDGTKIAFNILNVGRFKLGASATGGAKLALHHSIRYANERQQFNVPISSFGAMKHKLAEMAIRVWVAESMSYRTVGMIDALIGEDGGDKVKKLRSIEEYAVESSINKVWCSEALDYVVDEMVQIYGGAGYSADYPAEKAYRDARINRIFEGTNEINRLLIPGQLLKRAMKGELGLAASRQSVAGRNSEPANVVRRRRKHTRQRNEISSKRQENRADDRRHGGAKIYDRTAKSAGNPDERCGHHYGRICDGNRDSESAKNRRQRQRRKPNRHGAGFLQRHDSKNRNGGTKHNCGNERRRRR